MNFASLFSLQMPDLILIVLIVLLLFGAKKSQNLRGLGEAIRRFTEARHRSMGSESEPEEEQERQVAMLNRLLVLAAIIIFLLACGIWVFGQSD